jgi:hypothetical protein
MMSLRLLVPLLETRLLCFVCSDAFIGASLFEEVTQKIAPLVAELASPERILNFVDRQMSISVLKFPPLVVGHGFQRARRIIATSISLCRCREESKKERMRRMSHWEAIAES